MTLVNKLIENGKNQATKNRIRFVKFIRGQIKCPTQ